MDWTQRDIDNWESIPGASAKIVDNELIVNLPDGILRELTHIVFCAMKPTPRSKPYPDLKMHVTVSDDDPHVLAMIQRSAGYHRMKLVPTDIKGRYLVEGIKSDE